jgi:translation initiation factor 1
MTPIRRPDDADLVFTSDGGRVRPSAPARAPSAPGDGVVRVSRTSSGRGGKTVTLVTGVPARDLPGLAKELKRLCGTGGTVKDGVVEIQGDHRARIADHLQARYRVRLAGG